MTSKVKFIHSLNPVVSQSTPSFSFSKSSAQNPSYVQVVHTSCFVFKVLPPLHIDGIVSGVARYLVPRVRNHNGHP